jgi:hypothetical protein
MQKQTKPDRNHGSFAGGRRRARGARVAGALACLAAVAFEARAADDPPLDEDLQAILDTGMTGFRFARACRSIAEDGSTLDDDTELPVGGGRRLECTTFEITHLQAVDVQASTGEQWCALGQLESYRGHGGDARLTVSVADAPDGAPWTLVGSVDGEEIIVRRLSGLGNWPLWAEIHYDVVDLRPNPDLLLCEQIFGV